MEKKQNKVEIAFDWGTIVLYKVVREGCSDEWYYNRYTCLLEEVIL